MSRLFRILLGRRDDLNLRTRWWHRLVLVATVLSAAGVFLWALSEQEMRSDDIAQDDRVTVTDLLSYTDSYTLQGNPAEYFQTSPGFLGVEEAGQLGGISLALLFKLIECRQGGNVGLRLTGNAQHIGTNINGMDLFAMPNRPGEAAGVHSRCWGPETVSAVPVNQVTKFQPSTWATVKFYARAALIAAVASAVLLLVFWNIYYRVFMYIAFGRRP